jgi:hypothetical protein
MNVSTNVDDRECDCVGYMYIYLIIWIWRLIEWVYCTCVWVCGACISLIVLAQKVNFFERCDCMWMQLCGASVSPMLWLWTLNSVIVCDWLYVIVSVWSYISLCEWERLLLWVRRTACKCDYVVRVFLWRDRESLITWVSVSVQCVHFSVWVGKIITVSESDCMWMWVRGACISLTVWVWEVY